MPQASVKSALEALAADSAKRLQALVDAGEEIPYEVNESDGAQLPQYSPMTERFVREHLDAIRGSEDFAAARDAIGADLSGRYLEELAHPVPPGPAERAERALIEFLARVWGESSAFELDPERVSVAVGELEGAAQPAPGDAQLVTSLIGLQIPLGRLELAGATVIRADLADVPAEARRVERSGAAPWEPVFLAILHAPRERAGDETHEPVGAMLRRLLTTLRLFKPGGIAAGPHAWVSAGGKQWRRVSTGAPRPRPGGYRLAESELGSLADLARAIRDHPRRLDPLRRAFARFDAGLERGAALDSLNDHLLALRYMLEGDGPARTGLAMRAAALSAPEERDGVKAMVERAQALERELWSGEPARSGAAAQTPAHLASDIEELVRRILRDAARGRIGFDLRAAADEALLGDGLAVSQGADDLGGSAEWGAAGHGVGAPVAEPASGSDSDDEFDAPEADAELQPGARSKPIAPSPSVAVIERPRRTALELERETVEPEQLSVEAVPLTHEPAREAAVRVEPNGETADPAQESWLDEVDAEHETIEWPARSAALEMVDETRRRTSALGERVTHLFPRAETEWKIGELHYDRSRRAKVG